jgi:transketolase
VVLLSGDIGNRLFDNFKSKCPDRFYNCGIAEANMTSMAAGFAMCGLRPFTYTIAPFATTRALEQIRIDLCYQNVPVPIVGTGAGLSYASLGATHHSCEDVAFLRALPNMTVICPGDATEVRLAVAAVMNLEGPAYIRLGKKGEPAVHKQFPEFIIGKGIIVRDGKDVCLVGTGNMLSVAMETADLLESGSISTGVVSMHTVKPLDEALLRNLFQRFMTIAVIEEHSCVGGLGSSIAEWLVSQRIPMDRLLTIATPDEFLYQAGSQKYARSVFGLTSEAIALQQRLPAIHMIIGIDFDNTVVCYDQVFRKVAFERGAIPESTPASKNAVRDYLRRVGREDLWTELQGYVYGARMEEACPFPGVFDFFDSCRVKGHSVFIISHRTRYPYLGEKYDLHKAARDWIATNGFHDPHQIALPRDNVFFETTKQDKLVRIIEKACTHFVDDLPEFLEDPGFPNTVQRILFDPSRLIPKCVCAHHADSWQTVQSLLFVD